MSQSFEQYFAQGEENTNLSQKERKNLKLKEKIEEMEDIVTRMEKEGKTAEGYQRIIELIQKIEELYEEKEAKEIYQSLKETPLWDKEKKQWNRYMNKEGELKDSNRVSWAQLLGVLAEAVAGNLEEAKEIYQSLKETPLWDEEKKQWNRYMNKEGELKDSDRVSGDQLLGVLAEAVAGDFEEAKEIYQSLKETPLWDKEKKQWNLYMDREGELKYSNRVSWVQLLGVLAEAVDEKGEEFVEFLTKGNK
jgi:ABC-type lipoprotein release transport system permease subunit